MLSLIYAIYRWWTAYTRQEIREATQEWAINQCRIDHGKKPIVFDSRESHVLTIFEKGERLYLQSINTPNKRLKKAIRLGVELINEETKIAKMTSKQKKQKMKLLKLKQKELEKILKKEKNEITRQYKRLAKIDRRLEKLEKS